MDKCLSQTMFNSAHSYRETMMDLLNKAVGSKGLDGHPMAKRYLARVKEELKRNIKNRSRITTALDELDRLKESIPRETKKGKRQRDEVSDHLTDFRQLMNDRYNKVQAFQHGSQFLDLCEYGKVLNYIYDQIDIETIILSEELIVNMAELSWYDFVKRLKLNYSRLSTTFLQWMVAYKNYPQSAISDLAEKLQKYLDEISSIMCASTGPSSTNNVGPWDKDGTCSNEVRTIFREAYPSPYYFVGGRSFEAGPTGNDLCILCGVSEAKKTNDLKILRLHFGSVKNDVNRDFNTLLAPVSNPLNGGALENVKEEK